MDGHPRKGKSCLILPLVLVGLWMMGARTAGATGDAACQTHVQQKRYKQAARCYLAAFERSKAAATQGPARVVAGRRLRNAAIAFQLVAKTEPSIEKKAFWYERGVQLLTTYLQEKWFENRYRKDSALLLRQKWRGKIGYATLTVVTSPTSLKYTLKGYKSARSLQGTWSRAVRPGSYLVSYSAPGRDTPQQKRFQVKPGKAQVVMIKVVAPAPRRRPVVARSKPRRLVPRRRPALPAPRRRSGMAIASWTVLGVGVAAAMVGGGLWIGARVLESQKNQGYERLRGDLSQAKASDTLSLVSMDQQARSLQPAGIAVLISGGALTALGAVFVALATRQPAPAQAATSKEGRGKGLTRARLLEGQTF